MKLKYQMRGLGIGIMVTALLMGVATENGIPLSDAEIRAKALELGMVESDSLKLTDLTNVSPVPVVPSSPEESGEDGSDALDESDDESGADVSGETDVALGADVPGESGAISDGDVPEQGISEEADVPSEQDAAGENGNRSSGEAVRIVIEFGVTSDHVSEMLEEAGLVENAAAFDSYLCNNGLSRKVAAGTYEIEPGTSEEEIIQIITKN